MNPEAPSTSPRSGKRKASERSARTRAREFAVQALYQVLIGQDTLEGIDTYTRDLTGFHKCDSVYFDGLLRGCAEDRALLDARIAPHVDRPLAEISPIEHVILWIGVYELQRCLDVPMRVVLNESIELTKSFGGTDGHKFVNGVLHPLAPELRPHESA